MSRKSRVQRLKGYFYEDDVWSPKSAKRVVWSPKYEIFSTEGDCMCAVWYVQSPLDKMWARKYIV